MNFSIALVALLFPSAVSAQLRAERPKADDADKLTKVVERPQSSDKFSSVVDREVELKPIKSPIGFLRPTQRPTRSIKHELAELEPSVIDVFKKPTQSPTPACESTCDTDEGKNIRCQVRRNTNVDLIFLHPSLLTLTLLL